MRDTAFFFVCLPLMCCSVLMGPIVVLFSLHRAISPHLSPQLSPFSTALEARSAEFARSWERRLRPLTRSGGSAGGGGARQQQPQEKKASSATSSDQADSSVPKAGPGGRCSEAREDALVRRLRSDEFAVAEEASQGLWECWLRERGESVYSEIQAATRLLDAKEYQAAEKKFTALATSHPKWAEPINKRASLACATAKCENAARAGSPIPRLTGSPPAPPPAARPTGGSEP